jgi:hypothetical protein
VNLCLVLSALISLPASEAAEFPPLPGPGLVIPVDVDGDGVSSFADCYVFNVWLEMGGKLETAILAAQVNDKVLNLSSFFFGPNSKLSPKASVVLEESSLTESLLLVPGAPHIDFTRRVPSNVQPSSSGNSAESINPKITPGGRFVVFSSFATNLVQGLQLPSGLSRIYRSEYNPDGTFLQTILVVRDSNGNPPIDANFINPSISDDGDLVAFQTTGRLVQNDFGNHSDIYVRKISTSQTRLISVNQSLFAANGDSVLPSISGNGQLVAFGSRATDLAINSALDGITYNVYLNTTDGFHNVEIISVDNGTTGPCKDDLSQSVERDCLPNIFIAPTGLFMPELFSGNIISFDGKFIVFCGSPAWAGVPNYTGNNKDIQIFVCDRNEFPANISLVSGKRNGGFVNPVSNHCFMPSINSNALADPPTGRIVFSSLGNEYDNNLHEIEDVVFYDLLNVINPLSSYSFVKVSQIGGADGDDQSNMPAISADGEHISFSSKADNLTGAGAIKTILIDQIQENNALKIVSVNSTSGANGNGDSRTSNLDQMGNLCVYSSSANNLITGDTNNAQDIFQTMLLGRFIRGDANGDGFVDIADPVFILSYLFLEGIPPDCFDASDANDDSAIDASDAIKIQFLIFQSEPLPAPFPGCGTDPTMSDINHCRINTPGCF